jgi:hypothetical protein
VGAAGVAAEGEPPLVASAGRFGWLGAMRSGALDTVVPMDRALLQGPLEAAFAQSKRSVPAFPWRPTEEAGEVRGPLWHGPVTFLALRALHMMMTGKAPPAPPAPAAPSAPVAPPPSSGGGSSEAPPIPDSPLPPPPPPSVGPGGTKGK